MNKVQGEDEAKEDTAVHCTTTAGPITMILHRDWSPHGYSRAKSLFERGYYDESHFFRVVPHFLVQFGISYTTDDGLKRFADSTIRDDPKREDLMPFREGMISFAGSGPNSRTSQLFIAYEGAGGLGNSPWETPFGEVVDGMENVRKLYSYGDMPPWGNGPQQGPIRNQGSNYVEQNFPLLDKFLTCTVGKMDNSQVVEADKSSEEIPDENVQAIEDAAGDFPDGEPTDYLQGETPDDNSNVMKMMKHRRTIRGDQAQAKSITNGSNFSVIKILGLIIVVVILLQLVARRRKSKHAEKRV
jgi:peptidyl-prolyl cis-trans isomerase A (cyclophilin A)